MRKEIVTSSEEETRKIGRQYASVCQPGCVICLHGDLGSGKTTFVKGFAEGLGIEKEVTSPTFNIMALYNSDKGILVHIDAYRLYEQQIDLGLDEFTGEDGTYSLIEWPQNVEDLIPITALEIEFINLGGDERELKLRGPERILNNIEL
ncbi:MAG: tRNA (adenosine(37)-N6)-threonylcarbamoyltransferase complex ATPase subunit type 1 TsaE [Coprobacillus sp.]|nr:tRNA (adenosine(37)-N6)-threonylcarbamoyltransferase complex ATPase subunit type 1 TsaE [Coprobacillus sp.]